MARPMNEGPHRRAVLRKIIVSGRYERQKQLVSDLAVEGFEVSQATVSRDLETIGAARVLGGVFFMPCGCHTSWFATRRGNVS